jgi:hypothetical protein
MGVFLVALNPYSYKFIKFLVGNPVSLDQGGKRVGRINPAIY